VAEIVNCQHLRSALAVLLLLAPAPGIAAELASRRPTPSLSRECAALQRQLGRGEARLGPSGLLGSARLRSLSRAADRLAERFASRCVKLNQVQVLGSHNSYHVQPRPRLFILLLAFDPAFLAWEYTHLPLDQQFETQGIRQIELDVFADPAGGLYAGHPLLELIGEDPFLSPELERPGTKVLHVQDVDFETTCFTFVACLETVRAWSNAHRGHLPLFILVEAKDEAIIDPLDSGFAVPLPFGAAEFRALDREIRSVFPPAQLITPDDVRGNRATLEEAVLAGGWPSLGDARGRVLFGLDNGDKRLAYADGRPSLEGRILFTSSTPGLPDAAFVKLNDPLGDFDRIRELVRRGYLVRTRADADTQEARSGDTAPRDAALASGAHFVSTDYPVENPDFGTGYSVAIPGGAPGRCNPLNAPAGCRAAALEERGGPRLRSRRDRHERPHTGLIGR
jgi:hypothetical protein